MTRFPKQVDIIPVTGYYPLMTHTQRAADNEHQTKRCDYCGTTERTNGTIWTDARGVTACEDCREENRVLVREHINGMVQEGF